MDIKEITNLHSNMELLLPFENKVDEISSQYLHSNMELLLHKIKNFQKGIYSTFTFQYGATSTIIIVCKRLTYIEFTFQYGATSTPNFFHC